MAVKPSLIARIGREGKCKVAVTHLALLGVKRQETAFWGIIQKKKRLIAAFSFVIRRNIWSRRNGYR